MALQVIRVIASFTFIFMCSVSSDAQTFTQKYDGINFTVNGNLSSAPFNGGHNNARFQLVDIDGDSDLDLFFFDVDTTLNFYRNTGNVQNAQYKLETLRFHNLYFKNWFYFTDIDNDQDYDMFAGGEIQTVKFYRNTGSVSNPVFNLEIEELRTNTDTVIYSESNSVPVFCDIDNDGDEDFFTGQQLGTVTYYENIGSQTNFSFKYITDFWQNLIIISPALNFRHGANSLEFTDIDADNDYDLFWGDLFSKGIYFIRNDGTPNSPNVVIVDSIYPHNSSFISQGYNSTRFVDIDADGDKDMFVSVLYSSQNSNNFAFYRNNGTPQSANFQHLTDNYLNNTDVGGNSSIVFSDIDGDQDLDLIIGNDVPVKLRIFENTGTVSNPSFNLSVDSLHIRSTPFNFNYAPAFADLDNDGDKDLLLGSYIKDSIWFYRNTGSITNYNFTYIGTAKSISIDSVGQSSAPVFVDINNDNDPDLFIGASNGRIFYYENTGNAVNFNFELQTAYYNSIDVGDDAVPRFTDFDHDGDFDLFIGAQNGTVRYYKNNGNASSPDFVLETNQFNNINVHQNSCPEFADIDNDTDFDLFVGNIKGGLYYFRNEKVSSVNQTIFSNPDEFILEQNYPNPFNPSTEIKYVLSKTAFVKLTVYDIQGREINRLVDEVQRSGAYSVNFKPQNISSGMYLYELNANGIKQVKKMLFIK